nr:MFS transporter [Sphingobium subterraneum]
MGFGLVGIDRFMISTMFPVIAKDLNLKYSDIGLIAGALSIAWGSAALIMGNRADRLGRKRVLIGSMIAFSLLIGASGLANGLLGLLAVRIVMGLFDGAYTPACVAATLECSEPRHHGRASGIQQMAAILCGLGFAPLAITGLLHLIDWRWVFVIFSAPGIVVAWLMGRYIPGNVDETPVTDSDSTDWRTVIEQRNVRLAMGLMLCNLTCIIIVSAFLPSYLLDHMKLNFNEMGVVMSSVGIGAAFGTVILMSASDRLGRKHVMSGACIAGLIALSLFMNMGPNPVVLFILLFMVSFSVHAAIALAVGPVSAEAVPAALMATASGLVIGVGEIVGGGMIPIAAGYIVEHFGIERLLFIPVGALVLATGLSMMLSDPQALTRADRPT